MQAAYRSDRTRYQSECELQKSVAKNYANTLQAHARLPSPPYYKDTE